MKEGYVGSYGKLSNDQELKLKTQLKKYLYLDAKSISVNVKSFYDATFSVSGMTKVSHRLGFVFKQTKNVASRAEDAALIFFEETLLPILDHVEEGEAVLYYADSCHATHNTKSWRGWIRKGQNYEVDCNSGRQRINVNAAINTFKPKQFMLNLH